MLKVEEVANFFIYKGIQENKILNPMKLQKLLFFAYGWYLSLYDKRLFDKPIEAWKYGPVVASIYHDVKHYGNYSITEPISKTIFGDDSLFSIKYNTPTIDPKDEDTIKFLDAIWSLFSKFSAIQLSNSTHTEGTPWFKLASQYGFNIPNNAIIQDIDIKGYFDQVRDQIKASKETASQ